MQLAGLASNRGRNLLHVSDREPGGASLCVVLTNDSDAPVLKSATARGIPTEVVERDPDESRRGHEQRIRDALSSYNIDLVCLDGYMRILSDTFLGQMPTTLNVHPSLLPAFPGSNAWAEALDAGVRVSGCTIHVVTDATDDAGNVIESEIDAGPIVTQEPVPVYEDDNVDALADRILYTGEFRAYPRAIEWFAEDRVEIERSNGEVRVHGDEAGDFPRRRVDRSDRRSTLRYGENPHQAAALYTDRATETASVVDATLRTDSARELSYNNYNDADAAISLIREFDSPAAAVIKHTNPAGCATAETLSTAYDRALSTDPMSAYGGIVALNRPCDGPTADRIVESFKEVVVAPAFELAALDILESKESLRVLEVGPLDRAGDGFRIKDLTGGHLVQEADQQHLERGDLETVTDRAPTEAHLDSLLFAWQTIKHVKSNAILFATGTETVGIGMGQVSRVDAVRLAAMKADEHAEGKDASGAVMASDAFFPFPDGVEIAADAGIEAIVQPGGSQNDEAVIDAAEDNDIAMVFTGTRCFRHD